MTLTHPPPHHNTTQMMGSLCKYDINTMLVSIMTTSAVLIYGVWPVVTVYRTERRSRQTASIEQSSDSQMNVQQFKQLLANDSEVLRSSFLAYEQALLGQTVCARRTHACNWCHSCLSQDTIPDA